MPEIAYNGQLNCQVQVTDLDRAIQWYQANLGFQLQQRMDQIGFAILQTGVPGVVMGLNAGDGPSPGPGTTLTWGVRDIEAARGSLVAGGVDADPVREIPGVVRLVDFRDPDGNQHTLWAEPVA